MQSKILQKASNYGRFLILGIVFFVEKDGIMKYLVSYNTSVGIKKNVNQDALCIKRAKSEGEEYLLTVICDGMGGLSSGELASATVIRHFADWFEREFPYMISGLSGEQVKKVWKDSILNLNQKLWNYGKVNYKQLGTTLTVVLFLPDGKFVTGHVGDTRQYRINSNGVEQITEDQTFIAREIKRGNMTPEQAMNDPRRNVLLQCIGASGDVEPEFYEGTVGQGDFFLLCSDGFRHVLQEDEIHGEIMGTELDSEEKISECIGKMIQLNESRGENDNITAVLVKIL